MTPYIIATCVGHSIKSSKSKPNIEYGRIRLRDKVNELSAIGFCVGNLVKDKDGVVAAAVFAEMAGLSGHTLPHSDSYVSW